MLEKIMNEYEAGIGQIRGRLHPTTAYLTMSLLDHANRAGIKGNMLEIGVLGGRYLALMSKFLKDKEVAYGIDPFYLEGTGPEQVMAALATAGCGRNVEVLKARSDSLTHDAYKERFGPVRFMHIDGSHQYSDVLADLAIAEAVLDGQGFVAFDDFFNQYWLGVTQALFDYFERTPDTDFVPFGYCRNKLFLARKSQADSYGQAFSDFIRDRGDRINITGGPDRTSTIFGKTIPVLQ